MRATLNIPDELIKKVQKISGQRSKTMAITIAMQEYVRNQKIKEILRLKGDASFSFDWEEEEKKELKTQAGREKTIGTR